MRTKLLSATLWLFAGLLLCQADNHPSPPFVAPVPNDAQWTVAVTYDDARTGAGAGAKIPRRLQQIIVAKTDKLKHDTYVYSDDSREEYWFADPYVLISESYNKDAVYLSEFSEGALNTEANAQCSLGFTGVKWINGADFDKIASYQGQVCYHFVQASAPAAEAWIRVKDKMPVAYRMDGILYVYSFGNPPSSPLVLPPAYATVLRNYQEMQQRRSQLEQAFNRH